MGIVDSHVHLWDPQQLSYPWLDQVPALQLPRLPVDYRAAGGAEVSAIVVVEADAATGEAEVDWITALGAAEPLIQAIIAQVPLETGTACLPQLERLAAQPLVKGVRRLLQGESIDFCLQPDFVAGVRLLARFDFLFEICLRHEQLPAATELVRQVPEVSFVLDHLGKPPVPAEPDGSLEVWAEQLGRLADLPNVSCKLSGLATEAAPGTPVDRLLPYLQVAINNFGWERVLFGSDWPVCELATTFGDWRGLIEKALADADSDQRQAVMAANATRIYRLG